jgi:hypothetical protein
LRALVSSAEEKDRLDALTADVDAITRPMMYPQLDDAVSDGAPIAPIAEFQTLNPAINENLVVLGEIQPPFLEWDASERIDIDLDSERTRIRVHHECRV